MRMDEDEPGGPDQFCVLFWLVTVTLWKSRFSSAKSRKVEKFTFQEISARKVEKWKKRKIWKVKKSKSEKSKTFLTFWIFDFLRKFSREKWQTAWGFGGIGAQAVSTHMVFSLLFCCSFLVKFLFIFVCFPGEQRTCNQYVRITSSMYWNFLWVFKSWILKTHKTAEQVFGSGPPGGRIRDIISCVNLKGNTVVLPPIKQSMLWYEPCLYNLKHGSHCAILHSQNILQENYVHFIFWRPVVLTMGLLQAASSKKMLNQSNLQGGMILG